MGFVSFSVDNNNFLLSFDFSFTSFEVCEVLHYVLFGFFVYAYMGVTRRYHLFYLYNPYAVVRGNISWVHSVPYNLNDWMILIMLLI